MYTERRKCGGKEGKVVLLFSPIIRDKDENSPKKSSQW